LLGLVGVLGLAGPGCTGDDEPLQVTAQAQPSVIVPQTPLDGATVPKYVERLPLLGADRVDGTQSVTVHMEEFQQKMLPAAMHTGMAAPFNRGTFLWGYEVEAATGAQFPSRTIEARRGTPTTVQYTNKLQGPNGTQPFLQKYLTQDLTIHWADPTHVTRDNHCADSAILAPACLQPSAEPIPTVPHLHGAEVLSQFDGHPDAWFTPFSAMTGRGFVTTNYRYVNSQEATTLWFHDHSLGTTRLNVYSGMAGFYLIRDNRDTGNADNPIGLPAGAFEQELMIADRQFDTNGQLLFPDGTPSDNPTGINGGPPNPDAHPFWIPEFFGDVITVNGKSWPFFEVQPRRYRFRVVNASNARFYQMQLFRSDSHHQPTTTEGPPIWQIGSDGGLLNAPTNVDAGSDPEHLFLAPAERADIIIDFAGQSGKNFILVNGQGAFAPFPSGDPPDPNTSGQVMEFRVNQRLQGTDRSFNPANPQRTLRAAPIVDIKPANTGRAVDRRRQLILVEVEGDGGPLEVMLNNSHWDGNREGTTTQIPGSVPNGRGVSATEVPRVGSTEVWEIANLTEDAHPIHIHLIQFQVINRQDFRRDDYRALWDSQFPGGTFNGVTYPPGTFIPGFGPPRNYNTANAAGAVGGNTAFNPFVTGLPARPEGAESGWKDTIKILPFQVTRIAVRWAPTTTAVTNVSAGVNRFPFDPTTGGPGYVWHCHILDHEDNEMMRSYLVGR
jgi:FtsP/CotA-like multicopper oxidase with cupredoxin domain